MRTITPQTAQNVFAKARLRAAEFNPAFQTRRAASEELVTVTEDCLKRYELGLSTPGSDTVAILADAYNAPELRSWYCSNVCPLGQRPEIPDVSPEGAVMRFMTSLRGTAMLTAEISQILDDGEITAEEYEQYRSRIRPELDELSDRIESLRAELDRASRAAHSEGR